MSVTLRVVIAEDNYLVREGVRRLLEDSGQVEVVACVGDAQELLDAVRRLTPGAVLTDIRMPPGHHMEGIEAARAICLATAVEPWLVASDGCNALPHLRQNRSVAAFGTPH